MLEQIWQSIVTKTLEIADSADKILLAILQIALVIVLSKIVIAIVNAMIRRNLKRTIEKKPDSITAKKSGSLSTLLMSATRYVVYFFAVTAILTILGLGATVGSLLATAGIGGLALGLGAQSFIKDVVGGLFLMFDDEFAVGDFIRLPAEELSGKVETIALRSTRLRLANNEIATIPNGRIETVINYTRDSYILFFEADIASGEDVVRAGKVFLDAAEEYAANAKMEERPEYVGIVRVTPVKKTLRLTLKVPPLHQWQVERALNLEVSSAFLKNGIKTPDYQSGVIIT